MITYWKIILKVERKQNKRKRNTFSQQKRELGEKAQHFSLLLDAGHRDHAAFLIPGVTQVWDFFMYYSLGETKGTNLNPSSCPSLPNPKGLQWIYMREPPWKVQEEPEFSSQGERGGCELFIYRKDTVCSLFHEQGSDQWPNRKVKTKIAEKQLWSISSWSPWQNRQNPYGEACTSPCFHKSVVLWGGETLVTLAHSSSQQLGERNVNISQSRPA